MVAPIAGLRRIVHCSRGFPAPLPGASSGPRTPASPAVGGPDARQASRADGDGVGRVLDGRLSNQPDADGNPRLVAGSTDVEFTEADGSAGEFRSLFTAFGEDLLPPAPNPDP